MALSNALKKATFAAPLVFAMAAANAQVTKPPRIEPSKTDLSKPLAATVCVDSTPNQSGLSAWDKLKTIMTARGQMIALEGDQVVTGTVTRQEVMFTISNNFTGNEGYIITSDVSHAERLQSPSFCVRPILNAKEVDMNTFGQNNSPTANQIPSVVNQGELGVALTNQNKLNSKVALVGIFAQGSLLAVHFNPSTHKGGWKESDATGNRSRDAGILEKFDYSTKMKQVFAARNASIENDKTRVVASVVPELVRAP